jgi:ribonuclease BN (tRNA processing enzyme)
MVPSFGLMIMDPDSGKKIYYTGDTQFCPNQIMDFYKQADLIIQDCETSPYPSGVHANYLDLVKLPAEVKAKMMMLHYQDNILDADGKISQASKDKAKADGFTMENAFIPKGLVFDTAILK